MTIYDWLPKSIQSLRDYNRQKFLGDAVAGITVGLVALPLAMAFAIASGVSPQVGLYTAVIAGFLISLRVVPLLKSEAPPGPSWWSFMASSRNTAWTGCTCAH